MGEYRLKIIDIALRGSVNPKFQVEAVDPHQPFFSQKTRLNSLSYNIENLDRSFFHFVTNHAFDRWADRRTDRILIARLRLHSMQRGKNEML